MDGQIFYSGASISKQILTFTRDTEDTTDYTGSEIEVLLSPDTGNDIALAIGSGLTRITNTASSQVVSLTVTEAQVATLLGTKNQMGVDFFVWIKPTGSEAIRGAAGTGYNGRFVIKKEG